MWEMVLSVEPLLHVQDMQLQHTYLRRNKGFKTQMLFHKAFLTGGVESTPWTG